MRVRTKLTEAAIQMKPETIQRRAKEMAAAREKSHAELIRRLKQKAEEEGPDSIWAEMLADALKGKA